MKSPSVMSVSYTHLDVYKRQVLDVIRSITCRIMRTLDSRRDPRLIVRMHAGEECPQSHWLVRIPAMDLALLRRPVDQVGQMVMLEDTQLGNADDLPQELLVLL